ncbi:MAG: ABC transporter permease subunit [Methanocella sp.]
MSKVLRIAENELSRLVRQPAIIAVVIILLALSAINGISEAKLVRGYDFGYDAFFSPALANVFYFVAIYTSALAMFTGALSIAEDRSAGSMQMLLTKPVYRRDVLAGKFAGALALILLTAAVCVLFGVAMLLIFYGGPVSPVEACLRVIAYIILLFLNCALTAAITMAIGIVIKNLFGTLICAGSLFFFEWQVSIHGTIYQILGDLIYLDQRIIFFTAIGNGNLDLFITSHSFFAWADYAMPFILGMVFGLIAVMSLSFYVFCKEDG